MITPKQALFDMIVTIVPLLFVFALIRRKPPGSALALVLWSVYFMMVIAVAFFPVPVEGRVPPWFSRFMFEPKFNFVPFHSIRRILEDGPAETVKNIGGNILLLLPLGFLAGLKRLGRGAVSILAFGACASLAIETSQFILTEYEVIFRRSIDIDDLILNTIGYAIGYAAYRLWRGLVPARQAA